MATLDVLTQDERRPRATRLGPFSTEHVELLLEDFDAWTNRNGRTFFSALDLWGESPCPDLPLFIDFYALVEAGVPAEQMREHLRCDPLSVAFVAAPDRLPEPASRFRWPSDADVESEGRPLLPFPFFADVIDRDGQIPAQLSVNNIPTFEPTCERLDWCCDILRAWERKGYLVWWFNWSKPKVGLSSTDHSQLVRDGFKSVINTEQCPTPSRIGEGITNGVGNADDPKNLWPISLTQISETLNKRFGGWPRRIDSLPFVLDSGQPRYLEDTHKLFSWYEQFGFVEWHGGKGFVSQRRFYEHIRATAKRYTAIESLPHEPRLSDRFYLTPTPEPGDGQALDGLLARFTPETEHDRQLIAAMFATIIWGGADGQRPAFLLTADVGRGAGKTTLAKMVEIFAGGFFTISPSEDEGRIKNRLLTPDALTKRAALIDNIKSAKFSWDFLESLVTAHTISGHRLHFGEATRPNNLTWILTVNGASLSTDMAQRVVTIKLDRPLRSGDWEETTTRFIRENRQLLIADLIGLLRRPKQQLDQHSRWALWEQEVLSRLAEPSELQRLIVERQQVSDAETDEVQMIEEHFEKRLTDLRLEPETARLFIPVDVAYQWFCSATGERVTKNGFSRRFNQAIAEGRIKRLVPIRHGAHGRGYQWNGTGALLAEVDYSSVEHAIEQARIMDRGRQ